MTTFAQYKEQTAIPKLADGMQLNISSVDFDSIEFKGENLERVIFTQIDGSRVSGLGQAVVSQGKRMQEYFANTKDAEPIQALVTQIASKTRGHNAYWSLVDPVTKKAL